MLGSGSYSTANDDRSTLQLGLNLWKSKLLIPSGNEPRNVLIGRIIEEITKDRDGSNGQYEMVSGAMNSFGKTIISNVFHER
jgi:hypothetical protein